MVLEDLVEIVIDMVMVMMLEDVANDISMMVDKNMVEMTHLLKVVSHTSKFSGH